MDQRKLRSLAVGVGAAILVAATAGGLLAFGNGNPDSDGGPPPIDTREGFTCPQGLEVLQDPPPISDLAEQQQLVDTLAQLDSVNVRYSAPTPIGVVAFVQDASGDPNFLVEPEVAARLERLGVVRAFEWRPGFSESGQVRKALMWELGPVMNEVRRALRGTPGRTGLAYWPEGGAVVVLWKKPVPQVVQALASDEPGEVRVEIRGTTYSEVDVHRAEERLHDWLPTSEWEGQATLTTGCADGSGLVVGMRPEVADEPGLASEISAVVGMPVFVVPREPVTF